MAVTVVEQFQQIPALLGGERAVDLRSLPGRRTAEAEARKVIEARRQEERYAREQLDMWRYQHQELREAQLVPGVRGVSGEPHPVGRVYLKVDRPATPDR